MCTLFGLTNTDLNTVYHNESVFWSMFSSLWHDGYVVGNALIMYCYHQYTFWTQCVLLNPTEIVDIPIGHMIDLHRVALNPHCNRRA